jgi:hypothetical protein
MGDRFRIALDLVARIVGSACRDEMPPSFGRMCRKQIPEDKILTLFQTAQRKWVTGGRRKQEHFRMPKSVVWSLELTIDRIL